MLSKMFNILKLVERKGIFSFVCATQRGSDRSKEGVSLTWDEDPVSYEPYRTPMKCISQKCRLLYATGNFRTVHVLISAYSLQ